MDESFGGRNDCGLQRVKSGSADPEERSDKANAEDEMKKDVTVFQGWKLPSDNLISCQFFPV